MPRLAANLSTMFQEWPLLQRCAQAARAGFSWVEVQWPYAAPAAAFARALEDAGLTLVLMNAPAGDFAAGERGFALEGGARFEESIAQAIAYAHAVRCPRVHVLVGGGALTDAARDNLARAAAQFQNAGLTLLLEALNPIDQPGYALASLADAEKLRAAIGAPNVALQLDAYHAARSGVDPIAALNTHFANVAHVQIAHPHDRTEPDDADTAAFLKALDARGYAGYVGCEYNPRAGTRAGLAWARAYGVSCATVSSSSAIS